ncbi:glycoside hydrolase family 1 protein [Lactobacillus sp. ESL0791]|uniref:glycoside hydrolase family 1 protein n=1 Tax=Lactobacillus sp. ESL0791 TaxID=2983234 RepID=UPI0023F781DF|nr:glycoside hydrolase family 1 protein [Lactobacillus sp. ESL0791]MDF7639508.1 glycoside hydrolase family 1 protein [Lactobacillus sp. ESL0791]
MQTDFLWGGATASYQCEGAWNVDGKAESMWDHYLHEQNLENGDIASDHYHRFEEDIRMMQEGGQNAYRFSLSWPRIIKDRDGTINPKGIEFYNRLIDCCLDHGITPFVTLYHWDLPQYWQELGGWLNDETCLAYEHYAQVCFQAFGDRVKYWSTFNEPKWFTVNGYLIGNYPPNDHNLQHTIECGFNVMYASSLAVQAFKKLKLSGQIGIVHSYSPVDGVDNTIETQIAMRNADNYANNWVLDTAALGEFPIDLISKLAETCDVSFMKPDKLATIKNNTVDFLGLNYYARTLVKPYSGGETKMVFNNTGKKGSTQMRIKNWFEQVMDPNSEYTEWDTEIYPQGLQEGLLRAYHKYHLPIFITENGVGFRENVQVPEVQDNYRISFMNDHINALMNAQDLGADIRGYFTWAPFDLYSWMNGVEKRYGLVAVDFKTQERRPKASYYWYKDVITSNGKVIKRKKYC